MAYTVQYKCRKCGTTRAEGTVPAYSDIVSIVAGVYHQNNPHFRRVGLHRCEDGSMGVTDFIGAEEYSYTDESEDAIS